MRRIRRFAMLASSTAVLAAQSGSIVAHSDTVSTALGTLGLSDTGAVASVATAAVSSLGVYLPSAAGIRVALISSGVDTGVLPGALQSQVSLLGSGGDPAGFGTYAASEILQLDPQAKITSIGVWPNGHFDAGWQSGALQWAVSNARSIDVVLYAVPPSSFLDPVSAAMAAGQWEAMSDAISDLSLPGSNGPVFGDPLNATLFNQELQGWSSTERSAMSGFSSLVSRWATAHAQVQQIVNAGVAVVSPAGDLGPNPQTIFGIANFPEVVAVGGYNGSTVSASSSAGPSMDGHVKPDLLAPTGMVGLLPAASQLAKSLSQKGLLDSALEPAWNAGEPQTAARAELDSTFTSAAMVAMAMGGMSLQGVRNVAQQRGALTAASVPLDGVPAWRQGDGVLHRTPGAAFATSRPLVLSHGNLGLQPDASTWSMDVPMMQGLPTGASAAATDFLGISPAGRTMTATTDSSTAPPLSASVSNDGVSISVPLGGNSYQGGVYCGYTQVSLPGTSGTVTPGVDADGIPIGTEQVPTCLVQGTQLSALGFYIHQLPAENLTYGLLPALPAGESLLEHPLMLLPVNPLDTRLFFKVTGADGYARFPNIPPGYYKIRQWSDYGDPVAQTVTDDATGLPVTQSTDIGENPGYQSIEAFVLSAFCNDTPIDQQQDSVCTQSFLDNTFGAQNVEFEKSSGGWLVTVAPGVTYRFIFSFVKHMPGPSVSSRYIDLLKQSDFSYLSYTLFDAIKESSLDKTSSVPPVWFFNTPTTDPQAIQATLNPLAANAAGGTQLGIAKYPFNITTPNYKAHMSLNFAYDVTNASILVVVQMGQEVATGLVTPYGVMQLPTVGASEPINPSQLTVSGHGNGIVSFDFHMKPLGASQGTLYLVFVPPIPTPLSTATVSNMSFELDTWTNTLWPARAYGPGTSNLNPAYVATGHSFTVSSNYAARQMGDGCRAEDNGRQRARVCEDWTVLVHSPLDNAATFDITDAGSGASLLPLMQASGAAYFNPHRGTSNFSEVLAFASPSVAALQASVEAPQAFMTNGRFWEQLALPRAALAQEPGPITLLIQDLAPGAQATNLPHHDGPVPVAPYIAYLNQAVFDAL